MDLTRQQRWMLANQYLILEKLYPENADHYERARTVLENGFELSYDWYIPHIAERTMSEDACKEVIAILDMFSVLERSYRQLAEKPAGVSTGSTQ